MNPLDLIGILAGHTVYIQTHNFPDPDAIASAFGLQQFLHFHGIQATLCYDGKIDRLSAKKMLDTFGITMYSKNDISDMEGKDLIVLIDSQKLNKNVTDLVGDEVACIDHHPTFVPMEYHYQDIRMVGACASLIAEYYVRSGNTPDRNVATALLYGIKMDTLQFTRGVTPLDIEMFGFLFPLCDQEVLADLERNNMEFSDLKAYGEAIERIELYDKIGFSCIPFSCPDALIAILSDFILALIEVEVAVVFSFRKDGVKLSVRSEDPDIHAGDLLHEALKGLGSGGGHAVMGGGLIPKENQHKLGRYPEDAIRNLFLDVLAKR